MRKDTLETWIAKAKKVHGDKYDYSECVYTGCQSIMKIYCKEHKGFFYIRANDHINKKYGCRECNTKNFALSRRKGKEQFVKEAREIHGDKYDYSEFEYTTCETKSMIICKEHGIFWQDPHHHLRGEGCPDCAKSVGEMFVKNYLKNNNIRFVPQKKFFSCKNQKELPFDFYLIDYNIVIEFQGEQHSKARGYITEEELKKIQFRDEIKRQWCLENDVMEIEIDYRDIKKIEKILKEYLFCE